jgi:hypothetical protein
MNQWMIAAAAGLLILVTGTVVLRNTVLVPGGAGNRIAATLSERALQIMRVGLIDHVHCTLNLGRWKNVMSMDEMKAASGRTAMGREFIDLVLLVQEKLGPAFKIIQGHRCRVNQREYIHLIITGRYGAILSLVITEKNGEGMSEAELKATLQASGVPIYRHSEQQLEIAGFETERFLAYVASTLAPSVHSFLAKL